MKGIAISRGVGVGPAVFLKIGTNRFSRIEISAREVDAEIERFRAAVQRCKEQLRGLAETSDEVPGLFEVQLMMLDPALSTPVEESIRKKRVNAEWALSMVAERMLERQADVDDQHFKDRALDIEDVSNRLLRNLRGSVSSMSIAPDSVILARELQPSAILELAKSNPVAIVTERGGWTSHSSILAREFSIPMVSGVRDLDLLIAPGQVVAVNGTLGEVRTDASGQVSSTVLSRSDEGLREHAGAIQTTDGASVLIRVNADFASAYGRAKALGASGVGLYRSEILIDSEGRLPSEQEQIRAYREIAKVVDGDGLKIRMFDIAIDQISSGRRLPEPNPALGLRSTRLCLFRSEYFRTQIRAILQVSAEYPIDVTLPMISNLGEVRRAREVIEEECELLHSQGIKCGSPKIGLMVEIPSVVLMAREFAEKTDFLCLGTNDLVQYLLAVDRDNDAVVSWYQTLHPAVIRAVEQVIIAAREAERPVMICGEMAASPFYIPLLLGLGARELSMTTGAVAAAVTLISGISTSDCLELVRQVRSLDTAVEIESLLREFSSSHWPELFPPELLHISQN